jgi:hypothetical protein
MFRPSTFRDVWTPGPADILAGKSRGRAQILLPHDTRLARPALVMGIAGLDAHMVSREVAGGVEFDLPDKVFGQLSRGRWIQDKAEIRLVLVLDKCPAFPHPGLPFDLDLPSDAQLHYQPALTPEEIDERSVRPEEVVGSYAVYGRFGKFGHLYPGRWTDARGETCKAEIAWDGRQLRLVLPQKWTEADSRAWPVTKNLTFGHDGTPLTQYSWSGNYCTANGASANGYSAPATANITGMACCCDVNPAQQFTLGVHSDNTKPNTVLADTGGGVSPTSKAWSADQTLDAPYGMTLNQKLWLAWHQANTVINHYYDAATGYKYYYDVFTYVHGSLPAAPTTLSGNARIWGLRATYEAAAGGASIPVLMSSQRRWRN